MKQKIVEVGMKKKSLVIMWGMTIFGVMGATFLNANRKTRGDRSTSFSKRNPSLNRAYQYKANRPSDLRDRYQDSTSPNVMTSRPAQGSLYGEEIQRRLDELGLSSGPAAQAAPADSGSSMYQAAALYGPTLYEMGKKYLPSLFQTEAPQGQPSTTARSTSQLATQPKAVINGIIQKTKPFKGINPYHTYTAEQLQNQKTFFEGTFEGHPWSWWFDNYFSYFMGTFPFLFHVQYKYYPALYYDYFDIVGEYPKPIDHFDEYVAKTKPWPVPDLQAGSVTSKAPQNGWSSYLRGLFQ